MGKRKFVPGINRTSSIIGPRVFGGKKAYFSLVNSASRPGQVLDLNFSGDLSIPSSITFSRASSGTFFDSAGVLQTATTNAPRFGYLFNGTSWISRGLLIEEQRTNLCSYSRALDDASWTKSNTAISANAVNGIDGTLNADLIYPTSSGTARHAIKTTTVTDGISVCSSFVFKASGIGWVLIANSSGNGAAYINLTNGTVGTTVNPTVSIVDLGNGWYRCTAQTTQSGTTGYSYFLPCNGDGSTSITASGTNGIYVDFSQLENGSFPTSIIPTTTGSVIRSADVATISGSDFTSFFNATEGTIVVEGVSPAIGTRTLVALDDNTANESIILRTSGTDPIFAVTDGGVSQCSLDGGTVTGNTAFKFAACYKANDFAACLNGGTVQTDTGGTIPTVDRMRIGVDQAGNYLNGFIGRIRYYNTRLTNSQLQELTS